MRHRCAQRSCVAVSVGGEVQLDVLDDGVGQQRLGDLLQLGASRRGCRRPRARSACPGGRSVTPVSRAGPARRGPPAPGGRRSPASGRRRRRRGSRAADSRSPPVSIDCAQVIAWGAEGRRRRGGRGGREAARHRWSRLHREPWSRRCCSGRATRSRSSTTCPPGTPTRSRPARRWSRAGCTTPRECCDARLRRRCCTSRRSRLVGESRRSGRSSTGTTTWSARCALLDAMRAAGVRRIVFSSTAATYGEPETMPIPETAPTRPTNPYGASQARRRPHARAPSAPRTGSPRSACATSTWPARASAVARRAARPGDPPDPARAAGRRRRGESCHDLRRATTRPATAPACATTSTSTTSPTPTCSRCSTRWTAGRAPDLQPGQRHRVHGA